MTGWPPSKWGNLSPGHPERGITPGVETTTGPLGQACANAVGMAITEGHFTARYNRPGHHLVNHYTYVLVSDGDLMEGVAAEAASLTSSPMRAINGSRSSTYRHVQIPGGPFSL